MTERDATHREIMSLARLMADDETPPTYGASALSPADLTSTSFGAAREMFLNIFVSGALDHASGLLEQDKEFVAQSAAEYAANGVEALKAGISRIKAALGMPPTPGP